jgi:hypothetical protein
VRLIEHVERFLHLATRSLVAGRDRRIEASAVHITSLVDLSDSSEQSAEVVVGCDVAGIARNDLSKLRERVLYSTLLFKLESQSIARKRIIRILRDELFQQISARFHRFKSARQDAMRALSFEFRCGVLRSAPALEIHVRDRESPELCAFGSESNKTMDWLLVLRVLARLLP